ncbi:MAG: HEAT repeat domain-containing protein [Gemmataceae bacterium]
MKKLGIVGLLAVLATSGTGELAQADRPRVSIGFNFGVGYRPPPRYYGRYYYRRPYCGPRVYVAPVVVRPRPVVVVKERPVYVRERPVVIQEAPVVVEREPVVYTSPSAQASTPQQSSYDSQPTQPTQPTNTQWTSSAPQVRDELPAISIFLQQLRAPEAQVRSAAAIELGRRKVERAVDPLTATLAGDIDPVVREAAARALGLIGSRKALTALTNAAQTDEDRDVRRSAQFSSEIILANLRR